MSEAIKVSEEPNDESEKGVIMRKQTELILKHIQNYPFDLFKVRID